VQSLLLSRHMMGAATPAGRDDNYCSIADWTCTLYIQQKRARAMVRVEVVVVARSTNAAL
jgi:hypothetical protein